MISYYTIITVLFVHWVFDFFLQTDKQSNGKSSSNLTLGEHTTIYTIGLTLMMILNNSLFDTTSVMVGWVLLNGVLHFFTDYITSRASSLLFEKQNYHDAFVVIGIDQFIHYVTLFGTLLYLTK